MCAKLMNEVAGGWLLTIKDKQWTEFRIFDPKEPGFDSMNIQRSWFGFDEPSFSAEYSSQVDQIFEYLTPKHWIWLDKLRVMDDSSIEYSDSPKSKFRSLKTNSVPVWRSKGQSSDVFPSDEWMDRFGSARAKRQNFTMTKLIAVRSWPLLITVRLSFMRRDGGRHDRCEQEVGEIYATTLQNFPYNFFFLQGTKPEEYL